MKYLFYHTRKDSVTGELSAPENKRKVFISYKHSDEQEFPVCSELTSFILQIFDVAVWYDSELTAGEQYDEEIKEAIRKSDVFLLVLSENILQSSYIWDTEVPYAKQNQSAVIPIIAGISETDIPKVEERIGRIHMPLWFCGKQDSIPEFADYFKEQIRNGLTIAIANKGLLEQVKLFYQLGKQNVSIIHLTPEALFLKAYGALFGVDDYQDKNLGVKLMESICNFYGADPDFSKFQEKVTAELLNHAYRSDQPDLLLPYLRLATDRKYKCVISVYQYIYAFQWHPEIFLLNTDFTMDYLYAWCREYFPSAYESLEQIINTPFENDPEARYYEWRGNRINPNLFEKKRIGEIHFGNHVAYLQKVRDSDEACLIVDTHVLSYEDIPYGPDHTRMFLAYDFQNNALIFVTSEFDHYDITSHIIVGVYKFDDNGYWRTGLGSYEKGVRPLPYTCSVFGVVPRSFRE